jgi:hypothetical protein
MDEADIGNEQAALILAKELQAREEDARIHKLLPLGTCHNCFSPVDGNLIFCPPDSPEDGGCRDDWQKREDAKLRNGKGY